MQPQAQPQNQSPSGISSSVSGVTGVSGVPAGAAGVSGMPQYPNMYQYAPMYYPYMNYAMGIPAMYNNYQQPLGVPGQTVEFPTSNFKTEEQQQQGKATDTVEAADETNDAQNDAVEVPVCTKCPCPGCAMRRDSYAQIESVKAALDAILKSQEDVQKRLSAIEERLALNEAHSAKADGETKMIRGSVSSIGDALTAISVAISHAGFGQQQSVEAPLVANADVAAAETVADANAEAVETAVAPVEAPEVAAEGEKAPETVSEPAVEEKECTAEQCKKPEKAPVEEANDFSDDDEKVENDAIRCSKCNELFDSKNGRFKMCTECFRQLQRPKSKAASSVSGGYQKKNITRFPKQAEVPAVPAAPAAGQAVEQQQQ